MAADAIEAVVRHERRVVALGLALVTGLSWLYLLHLASATGGMAGMGEAALAARTAAWSAFDFVLMFVMWAVMMVAMMLPGAAPMILLFAAINRERRKKGDSYVPTGLFAAGYIAAWTGFSLAATALQWALQAAGLLSPMMASTSAALGAAVLVAAGLYQWMPVKDACLRHCQSPLGFIMSHWREGPAGAFRMGLHHGAYCVGCCWVLMALLFVGGVMNLLWIAGLALFVLAEKLLPSTLWVPRTAGAVLIAWGGWVLVAGL